MMSRRHIPAITIAAAFSIALAVSIAEEWGWLGVAVMGVLAALVAIAGLVAMASPPRKVAPVVAIDSPLRNRTLAVAEVAMQGFPSAEDRRLGLALVPTQQCREIALLKLADGCRTAMPTAHDILGKNIVDTPSGRGVC